VLTVLQLANPLAIVGPDAVGDAEQVVLAIDAALVRAGHRSIVMAAGGSECMGTLVPADTLIYSPACARQAGAEAIARRMERLLDDHRVDIVHMHGAGCSRYVPDAMEADDPARGPCPSARVAIRPVLITLHASVDADDPPIEHLGRRAFLQPVSVDLHRRCGTVNGLLRPIPNGVDVTRLTPGSKQEFFVSIGRIGPDTGFHVALDAARRLDVPLVLAGHVAPLRSALDYFSREIQPRLDMRRRYVGPISFERRARLLAGARAIVLPDQTPEPSSVVAIQALACGTPVIAMRHGALPEIVDHGRTGFLIDSPDELAPAMHAAPTLDSSACRRAACRRFTVERMTSEYLQLYALLAGGTDRATSWAHAHAAG
jgi:glycosyltransferase involved in cell wall biosynthesis